MPQELMIRTSCRSSSGEPVGLGTDHQAGDDRVFTTPNAALVLDGASQLLSRSRSGGWIADQLGRRLADGLVNDPLCSLDELLAEAIADLVAAYDLTRETAPSTTVSIVRSTGSVIDVLVLCDSPVIVRETSGRVFPITDDRLAETAGTLTMPTSAPDPDDPDWRRYVYEFEGLRNHPDGFWCAAATPEAAENALLWSIPVDELDAALAMSDGVSVGVEYYGEPPDWDTAFALALESPDALVDRVHQAELTDADCTRWRRNKIHDDKALAAIQPPHPPHLEGLAH